MYARLKRNESNERIQLCDRTTCLSHQHSYTINVRMLHANGMLDRNKKRRVNKAKEEEFIWSQNALAHTKINKNKYI